MINKGEKFYRSAADKIIRVHCKRDLFISTAVQTAVQSIFWSLLKLQEESKKREPHSGSRFLDFREKSIDLLHYRHIFIIDKPFNVNLGIKTL